MGAANSMVVPAGLAGSKDDAMPKRAGKSPFSTLRPCIYYVVGGKKPLMWRQAAAQSSSHSTLSAMPLRCPAGKLPGA